MVALGSFSRRVGASSTRRASFGGGTSGTRSRKTIYGSNSGTTSSNHPLGRFRTGSSEQSTVSGRVQSGINTKQGQKINTKLNQRQKWGFYDALVGQGKQREQVSIKEKISTRKSFKGDVDSINVRFVDGLKDGEVKWDSRLSKKRLSVDKNISRKDLAKKIAKISKSSHKFREQSGLGIINHEKENKILRASRRSGKFKMVKRKMDRNMSTKSSRRGMTLGDLLRK